MSILHPSLGKMRRYVRATHRHGSRVRYLDMHRGQRGRRILLAIVVAVICGNIWIERNDRIFTGTSHTVDGCIARTHIDELFWTGQLSDRNWYVFLRTWTTISRITAWCWSGARGLHGRTRVIAGVSFFVSLLFGHVATCMDLHVMAQAMVIFCFYFIRLKLELDSLLCMCSINHH